jgi:hypothetical protein
LFPLFLAHGSTGLASVVQELFTLAAFILRVSPKASTHDNRRPLLTELFEMLDWVGGLLTPSKAELHITFAASALKIRLRASAVTAPPLDLRREFAVSVTADPGSILSESEQCKRLRYVLLDWTVTGGLDELLCALTR